MCFSFDFTATQNIVMNYYSRCDNLQNELVLMMCLEKSTIDLKMGQSLNQSSPSKKSTKFFLLKESFWFSAFSFFVDLYPFHLFGSSFTRFLPLLFLDVIHCDSASCCLGVLLLQCINIGQFRVPYLN